MVGRIEVPASGEIIVPLKLVDLRDGAQTSWRFCGHRRYKPDLAVHFWYRRPSAPLSVRFAVRFPHDTAGFSANVSAGGKLELGINAVVGPPPLDIAIPFGPTVHRITIEHKNEPAVPHPAGGTVQRQYVQVFVGAKDSGGVISYHQGIYEVRIQAPAGTVFFVKGEIKAWNSAPAAFRLNDTNRDGTPKHANITFLNDSSILDPLGQHAITVGSYADQADAVMGTVAHEISDFSSRGPLRDYSDPPRPPAFAKPDVAAPGSNIMSAESRHTEGFLHWPWWFWGVRFHELDGTSMAAPMVSGLAALMLEKNPNLTAVQVRTAMLSAPRAAVEPSTPPDSTNAYGVGMVDAMTAHANTP
jgi:hypothetical protein